MASFKEIEKMMSELSAEMLVDVTSKTKTGEATYRMNQLRLIAEVAKSLDSIAYNVAQMRENGIHSAAQLKSLAETYAAMLAIQKRREGGK